MRALLLSISPDVYYDPTFKKILFAVVTSPFAGILGIYDNFLLFIIFQITFMFIIQKKIKNIFYSYMLTLFLSQLFLIIFMYNGTIFKKYFLYIIISLIFTILLTILLVFRNKN